MALIHIRELHIHVDLTEVSRDAKEILNQLQILKPMAKKIDDLLAKQDAIDAAVAAVRQDVQFIKDQLSQGSEDGLSPEEVQTLEARIDQTLSTLNALDAETDSTPPTPEPQP